MKKRWAVAVVLIIVLMVLTACSGSSIVGKWKSENGTLEFESGGMANISITGVYGNSPYSTSGDKLKIMDLEATYKLDGDSLTVTWPSGVTETYTRQK